MHSGHQSLSARGGALCLFVILNMHLFSSHQPILDIARTITLAWSIRSQDRNYDLDSWTHSMVQFLVTCWHGQSKGIIHSSFHAIISTNLHFSDYWSRGQWPGHCVIVTSQICSLIDMTRPGPGSSSSRLSLGRVDRQGSILDNGWVHIGIVRREESFPHYQAIHRQWPHDANWPEVTCLRQIINI